MLTPTSHQAPHVPSRFSTADLFGGAVTEGAFRGAGPGGSVNLTPGSLTTVPGDAGQASQSRNVDPKAETKERKLAEAEVDRILDEANAPKSKKS